MVAAVLGRNTNEAMWSLKWSVAESAFGESLGSGGRFCVGVWQKFGYSRSA
jgi:hypothetical protein